MTPRPYQQLAVDAVLKGFEQFSKQLLVVPTGGGKTCIFAWLAQAMQPGRTLILAHREELIDQAIDKLHTATGIRAGREKAESYADLSSPVVVGSVQSLIGDKRRERWPANHFGLVVVDEAHHTLADSYRKVLSRFDSHAKILGVTATPDRSDRRNLGEYFENVAYEIGLFDLVNAGYLSPITVKSVPLKIDLSKVQSVRGDFAEADIADALDPYLPQLAAAIKEHAPMRRVLCFLPLIATSQKFVQACRDVGLNAEHIDGTSEDRADKLERFANWEFDLLSNAMLLTEGFDDGGIDCIVCLRPTRSRGLYSQIIGRGTRIHPVKQNLLLLDFLWNHEKFPLCRPAHLIAKNEDEAAQITKLAQDPESSKACGQGELDLQGLASAATAQREATLAKQLREQKDRASKYMSAERFASEHHRIDVAEYEPAMRWERDEITPKQAKYLQRAGIDPKTVLGKGHASKLLDIYFGAQPLNLASAAQRAIMKRKGHPNADTATAAEARAFFASINANASHMSQ